MTLLNKRLGFIIISIVALLSIPLVAMQFTNQVNWSISDFLIMGILLLAAGLVVEFILRKVRNKDKRILLILGALMLFLLVWAELAVGIFGSPFAGS